TAPGRQDRRAVLDRQCLVLSVATQQSRLLVLADDRKSCRGRGAAAADAGAAEFLADVAATGTEAIEVQRNRSRAEGDKRTARSRSPHRKCRRMPRSM